MPLELVITQRIEWDMGHRLGDGYPSKCKHAHGHRYVAEVSFGAPELNQYGMVLDFGDIKRTCKGWIDDHIDHAFLVYDRDTALLEFLRSEGNRHHVVDFNPTVENIVVWLGHQLQSIIDAVPSLHERGVRIVSLRVFETPNAWADWRSPDSARDPATS